MPLHKFTEIVALRLTVNQLWSTFEQNFKEGHYRDNDLKHLMKLQKATNKTLVRILAQAEEAKMMQSKNLEILTAMEEGNQAVL